MKGCLIAFVVVTIIIIALLGVGLVILTGTKKIDKFDCVSEVSLTTSEKAVMFLIDPNPNSVDIPKGHYLACIDDNYIIDKCKTRYTSRVTFEVLLGSKVQITGRVKGTLPLHSSLTYNQRKTLYFEAIVDNQKAWIHEQDMASFYKPTINTYALTQDDLQNEQALTQLGFNTSSFSSPIYVSKLQSNWQCGKY